MEIGERFLGGWHYGLGIVSLKFIPGFPTWFVGMESSSLILGLIQAYLYPRFLSPVYFSIQPERPKWALAQRLIIVIVCDQQDHAELNKFIDQSEYHYNQTLNIDSPAGGYLYHLGVFIGNCISIADHTGSGDGNSSCH